MHPDLARTAPESHVMDLCTASAEVAAADRMGAGVVAAGGSATRDGFAPHNQHSSLTEALVRLFVTLEAHGARKVCLAVVDNTTIQPDAADTGWSTAAAAAVAAVCAHTSVDQLIPVNVHAGGVVEHAAVARPSGPGGSSAGGAARVPPAYTASIALSPQALAETVRAAVSALGSKLSVTVGSSTSPPPAGFDATVVRLPVAVSLPRQRECQWHAGWLRYVATSNWYALYSL